MSFLKILDNSKCELYTLTENGGVAYKSTLNPFTDLFVKLGTATELNKTITDLIDNCFNLNLELLTRIMLYSRDIELGQGRREHFKYFLDKLIKEKYYNLYHEIVFNKVPLYGRLDDLFTETQLSAAGNMGLDYDVLDEIFKYVLNKPRVNNLNVFPDYHIYKWLPREQSNNKFSKSSFLNRLICKKYSVTKAEYRKAIQKFKLDNKLETVENQLCNGEYKNIDYQKVPSVASVKYHDTFLNKDYENYITYLNSKDKKVNTKAVDIVTIMKNYNSDIIYNNNCLEETKLLLNKQYEEMFKNGVKSEATVLPIIDNSGSMTSFVCSGVEGRLAAYSLGIYLSDINTNIFKNVYGLFGEKTVLRKFVSDDFVSKIVELEVQNCGYTTNIQSVFDTILERAINENLKQEDLPKYIVVLTDMEFNPVKNNKFSYDNFGYNETIFKYAKEKYEKNNYKLPKIIFWNLDKNTNHFPVTFEDEGSICISGYNQKLLESILQGNIEKFNIVNIMLSTLDNERYTFPDYINFDLFYKSNK